jgi:hypothetical protein
MHLHPTLSHQMTLGRERDARAAAARFRLARVARCADDAPSTPRSLRRVKRGCPEVAPA